MIELDLDDADTAFVQSNTDWQITDVALLANVHEIDSSLANTYAQHVLRSSPLHLHYSSVVASRFLVTDASFDLNMVRGIRGCDRSTGYPLRTVLKRPMHPRGLATPRIRQRTLIIVGWLPSGLESGRNDHALALHRLSDRCDKPAERSTVHMISR